MNSKIWLAFQSLPPGVQVGDQHAEGEGLAAGAVAAGPGGAVSVAWQQHRDCLARADEVVLLERPRVAGEVVLDTCGLGRVDAILSEVV